MIFLQVMGILFCIVLVVAALWGLSEFLDWRSDVNERLDCHSRRLDQLDNACKHLDRSICTLYEQKSCK